MLRKEVKTLKLLIFDVDNLYNRIITREKEYVTVFAMKRTREHFPKIFENRFREFSIHDLQSCSERSLDLLNDFYHYIEKIYWYVMHTEDMPQRVEDNLNAFIRKLKKLYPVLSEQLNRDLIFLAGEIERKKRDSYLDSNFQDIGDEGSPPGLPKLPDTK